MKEFRLFPNSHIEDESGNPIATFVQGVDYETQQIIANAVGMKSVIDDFVEGVDSGKFRRKEIYDKLKKFSTKK